jgi:hypothetical protein
VVTTVGTQGSVEEARKFAEMKLRQNALSTILSGRLDIFDPRFCLFEVQRDYFNLSTTSAMSRDSWVLFS